MIKTLKAKIKDNGYMATNKDWLDAIIESTFHDLILPEHVTKKTVAEAFYKDMARLKVHKEGNPKCIMFKDEYVSSDRPLRMLGRGIAFIHDFSDADRFRDFCVSRVTDKSGLRTPFFDRGLCNAIRAIVGGHISVGENEYIRYELPFPLDHIEEGCHQLSVELIAFEHEGFVQLVIPKIDTHEDIINLRAIVGPHVPIYFFAVCQPISKDGEWPLPELSKELGCNAFLVDICAYKRDV
jgi:hypothetical protein